MIDLNLSVKLKEIEKPQCFLDKVHERVTKIESGHGAPYEWEWVKAIYKHLRDAEKLGPIGKEAIRILQGCITKHQMNDPKDGGLLMRSDRMFRWLEDEGNCE
jgi:hypothetical protein